MYPKYKSTKVLQIFKFLFIKNSFFHIKILNTHLLNLLEQINNSVPFFYIIIVAVQIVHTVKKLIKKVYI